MCGTCQWRLLFYPQNRPLDWPLSGYYEIPLLTHCGHSDIRVVMVGQTALSNCPACNSDLPNSFHRRLNRLWKGVSSAACLRCGVELEYESHLRTKLRRAGLVFRIGLIALPISFVVRTVVPIISQTFDLFVGFSLVLVFAGIFLSATKPDQIVVVISERGG